MAVKPASRLSKQATSKRQLTSQRPSSADGSLTSLKNNIAGGAGSHAATSTTTVTHTCLGPGSQEDLVDRHFRLSLLLTCCSQTPSMPHLLMQQLFTSATAAMTADQLTDLHFQLSLGRQWPLPPPPPPPPIDQSAFLKLFCHQKLGNLAAKQKKHRKRLV